MAQGRWFDGRTAAEHVVELALQDNRVVLLGPGGAVLAAWAVDSVRILAKGPPLALATADRPDERLYVADPEQVTELMGALKSDVEHMGMLDQRPLFRRMIVFGAIAVALIATLIVVPRATNVVPWLLPEAAKQRLGQQVVSLITGSMRRCSQPAGAVALADLARSLANGEVQVNVLVVDQPEVNAFAAPGGAVVLFRGVIDKAASGDALAAVLAHEIAHELHGHGLKRVTSSIGLSSLAGAVFGGGSTLIKETAEIAALFAFSRDDEREADATARELLRRARIDPTGMATFFAVLEQSEAGSAFRIPSYLSTHPATPERRAAAAAGARGGGDYRPALSAEQWAAIKAICD